MKMPTPAGAASVGNRSIKPFRSQPQRAQQAGSDRACHSQAMVRLVPSDRVAGHGSDSAIDGTMVVASPRELALNCGTTAAARVIAIARTVVARQVLAWDHAA